MIIMTATGLTACRDKSRKEAIADQRVKWEESLKDSLVRYEKELEETQRALPELRGRVNELLQNFTLVNNPREVEGYYIYAPARAAYPLTSTGITARLTKSEAPEIIAALKSGNFSAIRISAPDGASVTSATVPYDQALNYRAGGLNTVAFTGAQADSLLRFVASHGSKPLTVEYLNPQKVTSAKIAGQQLETLTATAHLLEAREELHRAEISLPALSRKIQRLKSRESTAPTKP